MGAKELLSIVPRARPLYRVGVALSALSSIALIAWTFSLARSISELFINQSVTPALIGLFGFLALRILFRFSSSQLLARASAYVRTDIRSKLTQLWERKHEPSTTGIDSTLLGPGVDALDEFVTKFLPARTLAAIIPVVVFVTIGFLDLWTLLILLFAGPMLILLLAVIGSRTRVLSEQRFQELGWLRSFYLDMVRGIPTLQVFGRANESVETIEEISNRFGRTTMSVLRTAFQTSLVIEWAATAATALVAVQVSFRMVDGDIRFASALAVLMLTPEFFAPLRTLAVEYHAGQSGNAVLAQLPGVDQFVSPPPSISSAPATLTRQPFNLRFDEVTFFRPGTDHRVLDQVSFTIEAGETVVITGPSGSGKTTLLELLQGQLEPTSGQITVNGTPLTQLDRDAWLRCVTSVPQVPFLFRTSVQENICLSNPNASDAQIRHALDLSSASEFVAELPLGIDTVIGEEGATLSGGQRQRLAIARAVLRDAPVVLLDEFTAHLDPETEAQLIDALKTFLKDRTALVIAHREATLVLADRVLHITNGRIVEVAQ